MAPTTTTTPTRGRSSSTSSAEDSGVSAPDSCDALLADTRKVTIKLAHINEHFVCKLCDGYVCDAQAIKECLHTFCKGCILPHFMKSKKHNSCPTCNVELGVRPWEQLIADPAIQELTRKLLPNNREQDKRDEAEFYARLGIKRKRVETPRVEQPVVIKSKLVCGPSPHLMIRFEMYPQRTPDIPLCLWLKHLKRPAMHTQALLKIMHLRKYIAKQLDGVRPEEVEVLCKGAPVGPEYSLEFIRRTIWMDDNSKLVLEYRRQLT